MPFRRIAGIVALVLTLVTTLALAQIAVREFSPPRTAVVDIYRVFESYDRKKEIEATLQKEAEKAEGEYKNLESQLATINDILKLVQEGSEEYSKHILERTKLQLEIKNLQKKLMDEFQDKHLQAVRRLRDEIAVEIDRYAQAHELDLVLEKRFSAESKGMPSVRWPIVHYARPEIEITDEIIQILNSQPNR